MEPQITPNTFCTYTGSSNDFDTTIFFISGNPGLIGYYHPFLSLLAQNLAGDENENENENEAPSFQIYGCSLGGFQTLSPDEKRSASKQKQNQKQHLYSLEDQIGFVHGNLVALMRGNSDITSTGIDKGDSSSTSNSADVPRSVSTKRRKVIIIGHSVGAYIAMEILRRHREGVSMQSSNPEPDLDFDISATFDIIGAVMLFPTVKDIAHSPSGQKLTTLLSILPHFAIIVSFLARILTFILPSATLKSTIRFVMKNPPPHALDTTFEFLKSTGGVKQALHMAADEMRTITSDKWTDDVWGVAHTQEPLTRLFFYFGRNDHWVAEKTRDEIIALRGRSGSGNGDHDVGEWSGPKMSVCEEGLPHAFCLKHNDIMAQKVGRMIRDIVL
ncbi:hypothetical protein N7456_002420 [Penicillium angulare]|uniref:Lipid droplet-associated hydrolase n=1 Tax=Penicillium angulare TaxID=116970 RepID=A0A9W9G892_9EURO|nr:hypothetical protein N7456_002420 [Penicillium angulare]